MLTEEMCSANEKLLIAMRKCFDEKESQGSMRELQIMVLQRQQGKYGF